MQSMADILEQDIEVPQLPHATALGAAIHGAVAAGVVKDHSEGSKRWSAKNSLRYRPHPGAVTPYQKLYKHYCALSENEAIRTSMHGLNKLWAVPSDKDRHLILGSLFLVRFPSSVRRFRVELGIKDRNIA
jgi:L-ribulokinase